MVTCFLCTPALLKESLPKASFPYALSACKSKGSSAGCTLTPGLPVADDRRGRRRNAGGGRGGLITALVIRPPPAVHCHGGPHLSELPWGRRIVRPRSMKPVPAGFGA